jgi:benzil reductase ((S)-benzoin forming)
VSALVIITGASSGLGLALARSVPFPARIIDISRTGSDVEDGLEHINADLAEPTNWNGVAKALASVIAEERPTRSAFIHSAGTLDPIGPADEIDLAMYARNVLLNSSSGQVLGSAFLRAIREAPGTHDLVMISSGAATTPYPGWSAYGAGKAAMDQWVRTVGLEQGIRGGVRVLSVAPGVINTPMQTAIRSSTEQAFPDVERFRKLKEDGDLVEPMVAARKLWDLLESGPESGSVIDLRRI